MASKKAKGNRVQVILECTEQKNSGLPGTSRYITTKNRKNTPNRCYPPRRLKGWSRLHKGYQDGEEPQDWCLHLRRADGSQRGRQGLLQELNITFHIKIGAASHFAASFFVHISKIYYLCIVNY